MKKDITRAITRIRMTPVEPPKLKATMASLSVSEADVRMLSSTWGVSLLLHMLAVFLVLYHYITVKVCGLSSNIY